MYTYIDFCVEEISDESYWLTYVTELSVDLEHKKTWLHSWS